jgi:hypothetical protein
MDPGISGVKAVLARSPRTIFSTTSMSVSYIGTSQPLFRVSVAVGGLSSKAPHRLPAVEKSLAFDPVG